MYDTGVYHQRDEILRRDALLEENRYEMYKHLGQGVLTFFTAIFLTIISLEVPKFYYCAVSILSEDPYHILPLFDGPETKSSPVWIAAHASYAIWHTISIVLLYQQKTQDMFIEIKIWIGHLFFVTWILFNCTRLGPLSTSMAILTNVSLCMAMSLCLYMRSFHLHPMIKKEFDPQSKWLILYLVILCSPLVFNFIGAFYYLNRADVKIVPLDDVEQVAAMLISGNPYGAGMLLWISFVWNPLVSYLEFVQFYLYPLLTKAKMIDRLLVIGTILACISIEVTTINVSMAIYNIFWKQDPEKKKN